MDSEVRVGVQIAVQRRLRGLTQLQLAAAASVSYLRKIEQGSRPATRMLVAAVARALGVDVTVLTGQPYLTGDQGTDAVRQFLHKLGYLDLAALVADRYEWAAAGSGDPRALAVAAVFHAGELDRAGDWRGARAVMSGAVDSFELSQASAAGWSVWGFLHLMSAYMCAHACGEAACWAHYAEAEQAARRLGQDRDDYRLAFGPTNVAIWGTALAVELMDGAKAVERAGHVRLTGAVPPERAGHNWLDLARGQLLYGKGQDALESLLAARRVAPQQLRYHPMARETLYVLARRERRSSQRLRELAAWMGMEG